MRDKGNADLCAAIGELAVIDGKEHLGSFRNRHAEVHLPDGVIVGIELSFGCQITQEIRELREGDPITIKLAATEAGEVYSFRRRLPNDGTESGFVVLELGA